MLSLLHVLLSHSFDIANSDNQFYFSSEKCKCLYEDTLNPLYLSDFFSSEEPRKGNTPITQSTIVYNLAGS